MANEYLLSEYADEAALQKQTAFILQSFDAIEKKAVDVGEALKKAFSDLGNTSAGSKQIIDNFKKIESASADFVKTTKIGTEALKNQNEELLKSGRALNEVSSSLVKNIENRRRLQNSLESYIKTQKEDLALLKAGTINQAEYSKRLTESTIKIEQYKNRIADLDKEIKKQTASTQALTREQKLQQAVADAERNSLGRAQALILLYTEQKKKLNLATAEGALLNENYNKAIAKTNVFIKANADEVTKQAKNVGNYAGSLGGYFNKIFQSLRTLANIIPGLGLSGIFLLLYDTIVNGVSALGIFNSRLSDTKRQTELLNDVNKKFAETAGQELAKLQELYFVATNANIALSKRKEAVDELQKIYPDYFKNVDDEIILQGKATAAYDAAKVAILEKAKAQAIEGKLAELATKELGIQQKLQDDINKKKELERKRAETDRKQTTDKEGKGLEQFFNIAAVTDVNKAIDDSNKDLAEIVKDRNFLLSLVNAAPTKIEGGGAGSANNSLQALKDSLNTEFEIYKIRQERKIQAYDDDIKSDKVHYLDKLVALKNYVQASQELIDRKEKEEIEDAKRKAAREIQRLKEERAGKTAAQQARINQNIKITEENLQQDIFLIQERYADKSIQLSINASNAKADILDKEYQKLVDYAKKQLTLQNDYLKKGIDYAEKESRKAYEKRLELDKQYNEKKIALAEQAEKVLYSIGIASFTRQLNALRDLQDEQEKKAAREIEIVNGSAANEEEKAARILVINARLQAQKDANEKKAREIKVQQAKFERAQQIFEITTSTIKSVAKIKAEAAILLSNPFTAALAPIALAQIPLVIASGAASVAGILAQPIPRFFKGKGDFNKYAGPAMINDNPDGKTLEVWEKADGSLEFPNERNKIINVGANDIIHPDRDAFLKHLHAVSLKEAVRDTSGIISEKNYGEAMINALDKNTRLLNRIADKPVIHQSATRDGLVNMMKWGANQSKWVDEQTQF